MTTILTKLQGKPIEYPVKFRCTSKFVNELEGCEDGLYNDVCDARERGDDPMAEDPVVGDFINRHKSRIEVRNDAELEALDWALSSGTTSIYMPDAVDRLRWKITSVKNGEPHEVARKSQPRVKDPHLIEGHEIEKHIKKIAKMMQRHTFEIVPPGVATIPFLHAVPYTIWRRNNWGSSGRASSSHVHLTLGTELTDALHVIIHELCHALIGVGHGHDRTFKSTERSAHRLFNESKYRTRHNLPEAEMR